MKLKRRMVSSPWRSGMVVLGTVCGGIIFLMNYPSTDTLTVKKGKERAVPAQPNSDPKTVLVTGAAGFIGHHLAEKLSRNNKNKIIGLDNFNDYYDVKLKVDRAYELHQKGIEIYNEDLCTQELLEDLFEQNNFTHVVHLAAQAGVRYSLKNPLAYIHSNVECQMVLLDVLKEKPNIKLVYASSSSVYGKEASIPFRITAQTDKPGNMYAATKRTDEILAIHYCLNYNLTAVGLRFFTVYGPFGRPDMAVYKFADSIATGKELPLFQQSEDEPLMRDFTYVDDIVDGIVNSLDYNPVECDEKFNLGYGNPLSVPKLITLLEAEMNIKANIKILPVPPTEILRTWADISVSTEFLHFKPKIALEEGVRRFVAWYKTYWKNRREQDRSTQESKSQIWFKGLQNDRVWRNEKYAMEKNERETKRKQHETNKYLKSHQNDHNHNQKKSYHFFKGVDSRGETIVTLSKLRNNIQALKMKCQMLEKCIGFNSDGDLKSKLQQKDNWISVSDYADTNQGLYIADINVCAKGMHDCDRFADCVSNMPGVYTCQCKKFATKVNQECIIRHGALTSKELEKEFITDYLNIFNVSEMKQNKKLQYFQGYDVPGGTYLVADKYANNNWKLQELCREEPICIGVNTDGHLKRRISAQQSWTRSDDNSKGIYIFDINYCMLDEQGCPNDATCTRVGPAHYECQCKKGNTITNNVCFYHPQL